MAGDGVKWEGLLRWSLSQADGTQPKRVLSDEERRWFMEAMTANSVDVIKRMKEITEVMKTPQDVLEAHGVTTADIEGMLEELQEHVESIDMANGMLEELQEHVESIDMANDLHSIGGLLPLLGYLRNSNASIRAKAADVVTTIVQNNPKSQQLVMDASGLDPLLSNLSSDSDVTVRSKSLGAISSLIRNNKTGMNAFKLANGYAALRDALRSDDARFQRKALNLIQYLLQESTSDCTTAMELGLPRLMVHLASSDNSGVREAALGALLELARNPASKVSNSFDKEDKLKQILQNRMDGIISMEEEQLGAAREERQLLDSLWSACYKEPSSLREKGLVVLAEEENPQPPPDVAGNFFEPPLRAWASNNPTRPPVPAGAEKKSESPLLLGPGPSA